MPTVTTIADQPSQNPGASSSDSTGGGGLLGGLVGGLLQTVGGLLDHIVFGTLDGYGDRLTVGTTDHPAGPAGHSVGDDPPPAHRPCRPSPDRPDTGRATREAALGVDVMRGFFATGRTTRTAAA